MRSSRARTFRILVVCSGNLCRSPAVERMLGHLLIGGGPSRFEVESAGTEGPAGHAMHPLTRAGLERRGIPAQAHVSRVLTAAHLDRASLVLTAERRHRAQAAALAPWVAPVTFTLLEFARSSTTAVRVGVMNPPELVAAAAGFRAAASAAAPALDDLADPVHGTSQDHELMLSTAQRAVTVVVGALTVSAHPPVDLTPRGRRALAW